MEGVQRLLVRKSSKIEEWDFWTSEDFKEHIERDPENVSLRIRYSISLLPSPLTLKDLRKRVSVTPAITALANALQTMPESEDLWMLYLELYVKNPSAKDGDVRDMFENGLCYLPECLGLWWRYVAFEQEYSRAEALLKRMLITFVSDKCELKDPILRSSTVLSIAAQLAKLYADTGCNTDLARAFLSTFLFSKEASDVTTFSSDKTPKEAKNYVLPLSLTWASRMLTLQDLAIAWLIYIHFFYHGHIPFSVFHAHPHSYLVRDELFLIKWDAGGMSVRDAVQAPSGAEMSWFKQLFQNCLDSWGSIELGDDASANMAYMAILRNYVSFIELRSKPARVSRFLSGLIECRIVDIDIMLLQPFEDVSNCF
ncbi:hypothetical protein BC830DRAFT_1175975 [Chytriomyces sp. MP71]|nr:hypothetical protein BC830DRAFT_1175975 [Chytriomyces sp. MP71]